MRLFVIFVSLFCTAAYAQHPASASNMALLGHNDLQARSAYQPVIHQNRGRWIAYVGHHGGAALNPLTGRTESGGAQMVRVCSGKELPKGDPAKVYMLRSFGNLAHEIWDVTTPEKPARLTVIVDRADTGMHILEFTGPR
jgi:hypothetical protein